MLKQAEQQARNVLHLFNCSADGVVKVKAPQTGSPRYKNCWFIYIGDYAVSFDGESGGFLGLVYFKKRQGRKEDVINIDAKTANDKARQLLNTAHLKFDDTKIISSAATNKVGDAPGYADWEVVMKRYYMNYPFANDFIRVKFDALDGEMVNLSYNITPPIPKSTTVNFNQQQAITQATNFFQARGEKFGRSAKLN